jgi:hypothetical protein
VPFGQALVILSGARRDGADNEASTLMTGTGARAHVLIHVMSPSAPKAWLIVRNGN